VNWRDLQDYQSARKLSQRGHFLTHTLGPATHPDQMYTVAIRVTPRDDATAKVRSASFYLGRSWGSRMFEGSRGQDGRLGITTQAYGPFLVLCDVEFDDGEHILLDHYCDFDMGSLVDSIA
jgi:pYEATS domain-containing protein involved in immunity